MHEPMTPERIQAIKARCEAATKGPWRWDEMHPEIQAPNANNYWVLSEDDILYPQKVSDFEFIANARQDLPDAIAEIERLKREVNEKYKAFCSLAECYFIPPYPEVWEEK